jgi:competence protein ComEC
VVPAALLPALALTTGAATGIAFDTPWRSLLWLLAPLLVVASVAWCRRHPLVTWATIVLAFACCGFILGSNARQECIDTPLRLALDRELHGFRVGAAQLPENNRPVPTRLRLTEDASVEDDFATLRARVVAIRPNDVWVPAEGGAVLGVSGSASQTQFNDWRRGRILEAPVIFRRPARFLNDGVPDFERDAAFDGISLLGTIKSGFLVDVVRRATGIGELAADVRAYVRRAVADRVAPHSALSAAIVDAVLIGDRSGLPNEIRSRLQIAGTYHVIAISGGNIAILAAIIIVAFVPFGIAGRPAAALTLVCLVAYALVVTSGPSVWRATCVAVVYLVARLLDHRTAPWQACGVAAASLAVGEPLDVRNAGFLLTFGATAALLVAIGRSGTRGDDGTGMKRRRWAKWLAASIGASAAVEIVLLPVMAETFSRVTAAGLVLNIVAVPAMAVVQIAGLVVVLAPIESLGAAAGWMAHFGAMAILDSARLVDIAPWLAIRVPPPSPTIVAMYYVGLAVCLWSPTQKTRVAGFVAVVACGIVIVTGSPAGQDIRGLRLTMFDVGQGDALMLQVGESNLSGTDASDTGRRAVMVDSGGSPFGGSFDIGSRVLEPALWARSVSAIDTLLLTHGDPDHIGGALPLIDDFNPRYLWEGVPVPHARSLQAVLARASASNAVIEQRRDGEELRVGEARVLVLHPPPPDWERQRVRNDDSVVIEVVYRDVALLLTGDIGADVERAIVPRLVPAKIRVLKVAHHGSRTSTSRELLEAWHPQIALISCGRGNPFGHPAPDVIARLEAIGARIYRTDLDGEVTLDTDGHHVNVTTFVGGTHEPRRPR